MGPGPKMRVKNAQVLLSFSDIISTKMPPSPPPPRLVDFFSLKTVIMDILAAGHFSFLQCKYDLNDDQNDQLNDRLDYHHIGHLVGTITRFFERGITRSEKVHQNYV
jgi:hypothetical protein